MIYEITVRGELGAGWREWFGGAALAVDAAGDTVLTVAADQAGLFGILRKVRDCGLVLVGVAAVEGGGS